jgi:hypothetical protein
LEDSGAKAVPEAEFTREMGGVALQLHQYFSNGQCLNFTSLSLQPLAMHEETKDFD